MTGSVGFLVGRYHLMPIGAQLVQADSFGMSKRAVGIRTQRAGAGALGIVVRRLVRMVFADPAIATPACHRGIV